jgi:hypothetical protein
MQRLRLIIKAAIVPLWIQAGPLPKFQEGCGLMPSAREWGNVTQSLADVCQVGNTGLVCQRQCKFAYIIASIDQAREVPSMPLNRHRDATGQEERKRNDTLVGTLRAEYGEKFAPKFSEKMELGTLKERLGLPLDASLNDVLRHFKIRK